MAIRLINLAQDEAPPPAEELIINDLDEKTTPADGDITVIEDSADTFIKKKFSWANIKAAIKSYYDSVVSTLTNKTISGSSNTLSNIAQGSVTNLTIDLSTLTSSVADKIAGSTGATDNAILRADGTGGKTAQSSGIVIDDSNNIVLPTTAAGVTTGIIYKGSVRYLHNFQPSGIATGRNLFIGLDAGNFTMVSGGAAWNTSYNIAIGNEALKSLTTGYYNFILGNSAGTRITSGGSNLGIGNFTLVKVTTANANTAIGNNSGMYTTGAGNTLVGSGTGIGVDGSSTYGNTVAIGASAGFALTTGSNNILIGYQAGDVVTTGANNIIIGYNIDPSSATVSNELAIGAMIKGNNINSASISLGIGGTPNANAILDLQSTTKAFMPPRMTTTQRNAVASPTTGMVIYNTTTDTIDYYSASAGAWLQLTGV